MTFSRAKKEQEETDFAEEKGQAEGHFLVHHAQNEQELDRVEGQAQTNEVSSWIAKQDEQEKEDSNILEPDQKLEVDLMENDDVIIQDASSDPAQVQVTAVQAVAAEAEQEKIANVIWIQEPQRNIYPEEEVEEKAYKIVKTDGNHTIFLKLNPFL